MLRPICFSLFVALLAASVCADTPTIVVHADQPILPVNKCLKGICIEDVNHEIYGGLYSQMIFGESFQEPSIVPPITGFAGYGGHWTAADQQLNVDGKDGPKLISNHAAFLNGTVSVELRFANRSSENAGVVLRVNHPRVGADACTGYEVSLDPARQMVRLARHRNNYSLIQDAPCEVRVDQWNALQIKLAGSAIDITVNGKTAIHHDDAAAALSAGKVGLRAWNSQVGFRNLSIQTEGGASELLPFEQPRQMGEISGMWQPLVHGTAVATYALDQQHPFIGSQSQQMTFLSGDGEVGISNRALNRWGMNFVAGKPYEGYAWAKADRPVSLIAALVNNDGSKTYAEQSIPISGGDWQRVDLTFKPDGDDRDGSFVLKLKQPGSVTIGYAFLQPGGWGRFKDLPVRKDVMDALVDQGVEVMRYGGSMVNSSAYRWKNMVGPRDRRPPYRGTWYPYASNGWGVIDFLNLCEAAGIAGVPDLNINESPQDLADFIQYVNGPVASEWGRKRAADGHPQPFHLHHLEIGNEERVDTSYAGKFNAIADVIWAKDPDIILVVGDFSYKRPITDPDHITGADSGIRNLDGQRKILDFAKQHNREVWFDVHIWSEQPAASDNLIAVPSYIDAIDKIANGAKHRVLTFELNANSHGMKRALADALTVNTLMRDNRMPIITIANGLQPDGQNDNGWDQGLLFLNPSQIWLQPPGYVAQMQARNEEPQGVKCEMIGGESSHLDVTAAISRDGKTLVVQVVDLKDEQTVTFDLGGFVVTKPVAQVTELAGPMDAVNTAAKPANIDPKKSDWPIEPVNERLARTFPPHSFTLIRFE